MARLTDTARLFDMLTRHQIYLEGVKAGHARQFNAVMRELADELRALFSRLRYGRLDALTRAKLKNFLRELNDIQWRIYSTYTKNVLTDIRAFMDADLELSTELFEADTGMSLELAHTTGDNTPLFGWLAASQQDGGNDRLWSIIKNSPLPANGILPLVFLANFTNSAAKSVENLVMKGYANGDSPTAVLNEILGTSELNYRDGALNKLLLQNDAAVSTLLQHVSVIAQSAVASIFYGRYKWVSVIDNATTPVCRMRDGKTYKYGEGPLPPAHIKCRSKVVPLSVGNDDEDEPRTYHAWLKTQPTAVQNDILGEAAAERLRSGKAKGNEFSKFDSAKPLTVEQFKAKRKLILTN